MAINPTRRRLVLCTKEGDYMICPDEREDYPSWVTDNQRREFRLMRLEPLYALYEEVGEALT